MTDHGRKYHIGFGREDFAGHAPEQVLLCGDPERARRLAMETEGVRLIKPLSERRGLHSYLAELPDGRPFLAATSGMGAPSLSIVVNELFSLGVRSMIRVGTSGSLQDEVKVGHVVVSRAALCRQGAAADIAPLEYPAAADPFLTVELVQAARRLNIPCHLGVTASVDTFYEGQERTSSSANPHLQRWLVGINEEYRQLGILNYEMEAGTLFKMAGVYGFAAGCVCAVLANRREGEKVNEQDKRQAEENVLRVAIEAATGFRETGGMP